MELFTIVLVVFLIVLIILLILWSTNYFNIRILESPLANKLPYDGPYSRDGSGGNSFQFNPNVNETINNEYSYNLQFFISDWEYNYGEPKLIFFRGNSSQNSSLNEPIRCNPGVWLYPKNASLMIRVDSADKDFPVPADANPDRTCGPSKKCNYSNKLSQNLTKMTTHFATTNPNDCQNKCSSLPDCDGFNMNSKKCQLLKGKTGTGSGYVKIKDMNPRNLVNYGTDVSKYCDISNLPIQKWITLTLVMFLGQLDVYIDGKLIRSCSGMNPKHYGTPITINPQFKGNIKNFQYFNHTLNAIDVQALYNNMNVFTDMQLIGQGIKNKL